MATKMLEATVRQHGPVAVIEMRGEIDSFGEEALNAAYAEVDERKPSAVLLNFAGVDYINSTGIALIVGLLARARRAGVKVLTTGLSERTTNPDTHTRSDSISSRFTPVLPTCATVIVTIC